MKTFCVLTVFCVLTNIVTGADYTEEDSDLQDTCCVHGETQALSAPAASACAALPLPEDIGPGDADACRETVVECCQEHFRNKDHCILGMKYAQEKQCSKPTTEIAKTCCEECGFGRLTGASEGKDHCGELDTGSGPSLALRSFAFIQCCLEAAKEQEATTTEKEVETTTEEEVITTTTEEVVTTTEKKVESTTEKKEEPTTEKKVEKQTCTKDSCDQVCNDEGDRVTCSCHDGYRLEGDKKTCKDINECREAIDDMCTKENEVCHNTVGSFKCVPIKKREVGNNCPPGFTMNVLNQVCDDINECVLPRPPCPRYLCKNTIGGYTCGGKPGKPLEASPAGAPTPPPAGPEAPPKNDICPSGFRAGPDDECVDVDECAEHADDCQRLSQYCINTNGGFFCQDHVSKRCSPGFKVNVATGICEDIDECEESPDACKRSQVCVNLAGAYNCKSKISTLPKLATKTCQEGTRLKPGGGVCEDIDECREGTHLCDHFQNCVNTYGGHECRCKNGFELDSSSSSCVDVDECSLKLDNCPADRQCVNTLGAYTCSRRPPTVTSPPPSRATPPPPTRATLPPPNRATLPPPTGTTPPPRREHTTLPAEDYYYYDTDDESSGTEIISDFSTTTTKPTPRPTAPPPRPTYPTYLNRPWTTTTPRTPRPERPRNFRPTTTSTTTETTTTEASTTPRYEPSRPEYPGYPVRPDNTAQPDGPSGPSRPYQPRQPEARPGSEYDRPEDNNIQPYTPDRRPEYRPRPPATPRPSNPPRTNAPPRGYPTEVTVEKPTDDSVVVEKDKGNDGSYGLNTSDIPKNQWTNVVGKDKPEEPDFDVNNLHCLNGYERDAYGNCVDINECEDNRHFCSTLENCVNMEGGYRCDCISGFQKDATGWCVPVRHPPTTPRATTPRPTTPKPTTTSTTSTTTPRPTETEVAATPSWRRVHPSRPRRPYAPPRACELGYIYNTTLRRCVDINECARDTGICAANEDCVNQEGGYYCVCGAPCQNARRTPSPAPYEPSPPSLPPSVDPYRPSGVDGDSNVITVGAQYGQKGPRYLRPSYTRLPNTGAIVTSCLWGYKLTVDKMCYDIDECAKNVSQCGPEQRCENFYGGYSCQCPAGHKLYGKDGCDDIDECKYGSPCPYNAKCVNTVGSYRCECADGFRNSPANDKVCVDVDECAETPHVCHQSCSNTWGSYRCYCKRGYRLTADNRTCEDMDECAEWGNVHLRGRLCGGSCVNEPGSYRCACPAGYRLGDDGKSCIDIDECETGAAECAASRDPGHVCQNTRGGYHCHRIQCPPGYQLEAKHRCARIQRSCPFSDWSCLQQPSAYSYNFITFVANIYLPKGSVDLFTMHGPSWRDSVVSFEMRMIDVQASAGVQPADLRCFDMRPMDNVCVISLLCSLGGPQVAELELTMSLYQRGQFAGNAVARLIIIVSQYDF